MFEKIKNVRVTKDEALVIGTAIACTAASTALAVYQIKIWVALQAVGVGTTIALYSYAKIEQAKSVPTE